MVKRESNLIQTPNRETGEDEGPIFLSSSCRGASQ